ncbi:MAG: gamma-glutamylcyclotransferase [Gammaproteobacteria bacterium]|nr:gamma-glutamylcyclotransferase [Gammaproteobacteria bacterium]MBU2477998.1 gamma-glutamylcyclotransferase [Gammaproteobacteria bacterium]
MADTNNDSALTTTYVAVYGTLMSGVTDQITDPRLRAEAEQARRLLGRCVGPCDIPGKLYDLGQYPGLMIDSDAAVKGELYELPFGEFNSEGHARFREAIAALDAYEGYDPDNLNESEYVRRCIRLRRPADTSAWVYVLNTPGAADALTPLPSGDWR